MMVQLALKRCGGGKRPWKSHSEVVRGPWHEHRHQERNVAGASGLKRP